MKKVLIPIDFSDNSLNALHYGQCLFKPFEVTFYLFSAYTVQPSNLLGDEWGNEWETSVRLGVDDDLKEIVAHSIKSNRTEQHYFKAISQSGLLVPTVKRLVKELEIDFILMGTKGSRGLKSVFVGSNAVKVINGVPNCPKIIVPHDFIPKRPSQIVFSTNYKKPFHKTELAPLVQFVKALAGRITIVQLMEDTTLSSKQQLFKEALVSLMDEIPHNFQKLILETSEAKAIKDFIKNSESDMVVFVYHKYNFFSKLMEEDVIEKITFDSSVPILVLPEITAHLKYG